MNREDAKTELTEEMRGWLNERQFIRDELVIDMVRAFMSDFNLTPRAAGRLIGHWIVTTTTTGA